MITAKRHLLCASAAVLLSVASPAAASAAHFDIQPQALSDALRAFGLQSGVAIAFRPNDLRRARSPGAVGDYQPDAALAEILKGTPFHAVTVKSGFVVVASSETGAAERLDHADALAPPDAAAPAEAPAVTVQEVVVTAEKRSERINDVPMAITALSAEQLQARGVLDPAGLARVVPGFVAQTSIYGAPVFYLRGVGFSDPNLSMTPTVSVYADEAPLPFSTMARGAGLDPAQVEILKGPQGTLYGQNSTGGAINYIAAKPTETFQAGADGDIGRFAAINLSGFVSGPISDSLRGRIALESQTQNDWQFSTTRDDQRGQRRFLNARGIIDWTPNDRARFELTVQGWRDRSDTQAPQFVYFSPQAPSGDPVVLAAMGSKIPAPDDSRAADWDPGSPTKRNDSLFRTALRGDVQLTDSVVLTSLTGYAQLNARDPLELDGTDFRNFFELERARIDAVSQEFRIAGDTPAAHWLIGLNYEHENTKEGQYVFLNSTNDSLLGKKYSGTFQFNNQQVATYAIFGGIDYKLMENLRLRGSIRYTKQNRDHQGCLADPGDGSLAGGFSLLSSILSQTAVTIAPGQCVTMNSTTFLPVGISASNSLDQNNVSWRAAVDWKATPTVLVYATVAKGYKSGGFTTVPAVFDIQMTPVNQEALLAYEAGVKAGLFDRRVQVNVSGFYYDYKDKQLQGYEIIAPFGALPTLVNIPKSRVEGFEAEITAQVTSTTNLHVAGTFVDTQVQENPAITISPLGDQTSFVGEPFPYAPRWQLNADLEQRFPVSDRTEAYVGADVAYRSSASAEFGRDATPLTQSLFTIPSYTLLDLRAGVRFDGGRYLVELWGRNVTNKFYVNNIAVAGDSVVRFTGMPATYGLRFSYRM